MAKRRRKVKIGRLILAIVIVLVLALLLVFGIKFFLSKLSVKEEIQVNEVIENEISEEIVEEIVEETKDENIQEGIKIDLVDYECYPNNIFDFDFIIARVRFKDSEAVKYDLSKMVTSEGIKLNSVQSYIDELTNSNYMVSKKNVETRIETNELSYIATLFIPYTTDDMLLTVDCGNNETLSFNLGEKYCDIADLLYEGGTTIKSDNYDIFVEDAAISYMLYEGNNYIDIPSRDKIYSFILNVNDIKSGVTLKEAKYVSGGKEYEALPKEYTSDVVYNNMFASQLEKGNSYGLLFKVMSQDTDRIVYDGELWLKFSSSDEWIKISARFD